jgi:hypothetical protein
MTADGNEPAYQPARAARRGHVESYFVKLNSPDGTRALWLKWTLFAAPGAPAVAECWAIAFARGRAPRAVKRTRPLDAPAMVRTPFALAFGDAYFDGRRAHGLLASGGTRVAWDITLAPRLPALRPLPYAWMYESPVPETKLTSPVPDATAAGWFEIDGDRVDVTGWRGMQGHNWGTRHTHRYAWCQATGFDGAEDVVFEGLSGRLRRAGRELPWLTLAFLWVDDRWVRFDTPVALTCARAEAEVMRWRFETRAAGFVLRGEASAAREDTAGLHYANPQGPVTYCLNSKLAHLALTLEGPGGARAFATAHAALELGWPSADHGIAMLA